jgi:hypothetical protein
MKTPEPPIEFNMDLANAPTSARFCHYVAAMDEVSMAPELRAELEIAEDDDDIESVHGLLHEAEDVLFAAGFYVRWDAGDVVVWDLRQLSDDEREAFYFASEGF